MKLTSAIQESLVALLLYDDTPGGAKAVAGLIQPPVYDAYFRDIAAAAVEYIEAYGKAPGEHALDLIDTLKARKPDDAKIYDRIFASIEITRSGINREYVINSATAFAKHQRIRTALARAVDALQANTPESVDETSAILEEGLKGTYNLFDPGVFFHDSERSLSFLNMEERQAFPTGIDEFDVRGLGPARKKLNVFGASTGAGKSWWLINLAKHALLARAKVLYISLEMDSEEVFQRITQAFFSITKRKGDVKRQKFTLDPKGHFAGFEEEVLADRPALTDENIRSLLVPKVEAFRRKPGLLVRSFPTGSLTMRALKAYLSSLEGSTGFIPDLILVDYVDLFDIDPKNKRLELDKLYVDLRGIGVERNVAVATVTQNNAEGGQARTATKFHAAEAKSKINHADVFITFNQTQDEYELGLARLFVAKGRSEADKFSVLIAQGYAAGQFAFQSVPMTKTYWEHIEKDLDEEEGEED